MTAAQKERSLPPSVRESHRTRAYPGTDHKPIWPGLRAIKLFKRKSNYVMEIADEMPEKED